MIHAEEQTLSPTKRHFCDSPAIFNTSRCAVTADGGWKGVAPLLIQENAHEEIVHYYLLGSDWSISR